MICLKGSLEIPRAAKYVVSIGELYEIDPFPLTSSSVWGPGSFSYLARLALNSYFQEFQIVRSFLKARVLKCILQALQKDGR